MGRHRGLGTARAGRGGLTARSERRIIRDLLPDSPLGARCLTNPELSLSFSGAQKWRDCQQSYDYTYHHHIQKKARSAPLTLGNWLHSYLERYYKVLMLHPEVEPLAAHEFAVTKTTNEYGPKIEGYAQAAAVAGEQESAEALLELPEKGVDIANRYYHYRGLEDAGRYEFLFVEQRLEHPADDGLRVPGIADLVVRDRSTGEVQMWDHKSSENSIPDRNSHILDMQLVLYAVAFEKLHGLVIDKLIWNYLRTKLPTVPKPLKPRKKDEEPSQLSVDRAIDTDWQTYTDAIVKHGFDTEDERYKPILNRLQPRAMEVFFPRHTLYLLDEVRPLVMRDFVGTANEIKHAYSDMSFIPVRNLGRACNWCDFRKICEAVVTGGDPSEIIERQFTRGGK